MTRRPTGIYWQPAAKLWLASIAVSGKSVYLGHYKRKKDAARAYDKAAKETYCEHASLNLL